MKSLKLSLLLVFSILSITVQSQSDLDKVKLDIGVVGGDVNVYEIYNSHLEDPTLWEMDCNEEGLIYAGNSEVSGDFKMFLDSTTTFLIETFIYILDKKGRVKDYKLGNRYIVRFVPGSINTDIQDQFYCVVQVRENYLKWSNSGEVSINAPATVYEPNVLELVIE
jgi:hypothetical protein